MTAIHPRVCLHQVVYMRKSTTDFIGLCRQLGVPHMTLATPLIYPQPGGVEAVLKALGEGGPRASIINHPFATFPNLERDSGEASARMLKAIDDTVLLGAKAMYLQTGGRGSLDWEQAAARFADLLAPAMQSAAEKGVSIMIENASPFNIDMHIAHTLADTILLAEMTGIEVCIDLQPCFGEARLPELFRRALPITKLVQVSDYVLGDRVAPCRAVPGDGMVPLERLIRDLLDAGYEGIFDLELVGPRIDEEGGASAAKRSVEWLSELLTRLGA